MAVGYCAFLERKTKRHQPCGFDPGVLHTGLKGFQEFITRRSLRRGRNAIFSDCGTGKTFMQLVWGHHVAERERAPVLVLAPLAVSRQTEREGRHWGIPVTICRKNGDVRPGVNITNYGTLQHFDASAFAGVVLDESSILKSYTGKIRNQIIESFAATPYRLACTATPSPNDYMELGNTLGPMEFVCDDGKHRRCPDPAAPPGPRRAPPSLPAVIAR